MACVHGNSAEETIATPECIDTAAHAGCERTGSAMPQRASGGEVGRYGTSENTNTVVQGSDPGR